MNVGAAIAVACSLCTACDGEQSSGPAASGSVAQAAVSSVYTPPSSLVPRHAAAPTPRCRVMSVKGEVKLGDTTLKPGALKDGTLTSGEEWLDLSVGAELGLQHTASARQWRVTGPARLKACVDGDEVLWLARGVVVSGAGSGMRPGAQVTIATPVGNVLYGDTKLTLKVTKDQAEVNVESGNGLLIAAPNAKLQGKAEVQAKQHAALKGSGDALERSQALLKACEAGADEAARLARAVLAPTAPAPSASSRAVATRGSLGSRARSHAEARGKAREICAAAWASVGSISPDSPEVAGFEKRLKAAHIKWREVPMPPRKAPTPPDKGE